MRYELGGLEKHMTSSPWCNVALLLQPMASITTGSEELFFVGRPAEEEPVSNLQKVVEYARELLEAVARQNSTIESLRYTIEHLENRLSRMALKVSALEALEATQGLEKRGGPAPDNPLRRIEEGIGRLEEQFRIPQPVVGVSWGTTSVGITQGSSTGDTITYRNDPRTFTTAPALMDDYSLTAMDPATGIDTSVWSAGEALVDANRPTHILGHPVRYITGMDTAQLRLTSPQTDFQHTSVQGIQENLSRALAAYMAETEDRQMLEGTSGESG